MTAPRLVTAVTAVTAVIAFYLTFVALGLLNRLGII